MEEKMKIDYSEIFEILKYMNKKQVMKIPIELLETFKNNRKKDYKSKINKYDIFNKNNISRETLALLAYLNLNYWVDDEKRESLKKLYSQNEFEKNEFKKQIYPIDLFNKSDIKKDEEIFYDNLPILPKENVLKKIFKYIINFLKK